jgi:hypothetical protein
LLTTSRTTVIPSDLSLRPITSTAAAKLIHHLLVLAVDAILNGTTSAHATLTDLAVASTTHTVWTVAGHVAGVATDTADDVGGEVASVGAVVFAVSNFATVLAGLVLVVAEGAVQGGQFAKLITLELILAFGDGCGLQHVSVLPTMYGMYSSNLPSQ